MDGHNDLVTPVSFDRWTGEGAVHDKDISLVSIWRLYFPGDGEIIISGHPGVGIVIVLVVSIIRPVTPRVPVRHGAVKEIVRQLRGVESSVHGVSMLS